MKHLITGVAGFIGMSLADYMLNLGEEIIGIDNMDNYYDVNLKRKRIINLEKHAKFKFHSCDISNKDSINKIIFNNKIEYIIHLAAQAGIRDYEKNIEKYIKSNILGFINILEASKKHKIKHLTYASSSSVYGNTQKSPFKENFITDSQISFYAATKKFNEIISKTYANMEHISNVGLRFFTVYGPWGRPDMSPHKFTSNIFNSKKIILNNNGNIKRDFTFINDAVEATYLIHKKKISERELGLMSTNDNMIFNIGSSKLTNISTLINILEKLIGKKALVEYSGAIKGDMEFTYSDNKSLMNYINYQPKTELVNGLEKLVKWYNDHYMT